MSKEIKELYFFGCGNNEKGHYWFGRCTGEHQIAKNLNCSTNLIRRIDGTFVPDSPTHYAQQGYYQESIIGHVRIISWADFTIDPRPGSNSNLVGVGFESAEQMIEEARTQFHWFMERQPLLVPINAKDLKQ